MMYHGPLACDVQLLRIFLHAMCYLVCPQPFSAISNLQKKGVRAKKPKENMEETSFKENRRNM